jgi:cytochrome c peroxidase
LFDDPMAGCVACHPPPHFAKKDFSDNPQQAFAPTTLLTARDAAFTLIGMNRLDYINGYRRDLEPWDIGRAEETQGHFTSLQLRGIWDRPPVFLHSGMARTLHEVLVVPGHPALRTYKYEPLIGGFPERPGRREVGFNMTLLFAKASPKVSAHMAAGARVGFDTHGGTSHLTALDIDDLVNFLNTIE